MVSILLGVITALLIILSCGGCFYAGYRVGYANIPKEPQEEKPKAGMSEEQKRLYEGMQNILNHANRHGGGNK